MSGSKRKNRVPSSWEYSVVVVIIMIIIMTAVKQP